MVNANVKRLLNSANQFSGREKCSDSVLFGQNRGPSVYHADLYDFRVNDVLSGEVVIVAGRRHFKTSRMQEINTGSKERRRNFFQKLFGLAFVSGLAPLSSLMAEPVRSNNSEPVRPNAVTADPLLGQIAIFPYNFAPQGWAKCDGQLLAISSNTALFALIGTIYGGDGQSTFGLPDLRGRTAIGYGAGPGLATRNLGQKGGTQTIPTTPQHSHTGTVSYPAHIGAGDDTQPNGRFPSTAPTDFYADSPTPGVNLGTANVTVANAGTPSPTNEMPYLAMGYYIALSGVFPST